MSPAEIEWTAVTSGELPKPDQYAVLLYNDGCAELIYLVSDERTYDMFTDPDIRPITHWFQAPALPAEYREE
jgi:hypothetical protein